MSDFGACIQAAIDAGQVDPRRAARAMDRWRDLVQRHADAGIDPAGARLQAAEDVLESITREGKANRHTTLAQVRTMAEIQRRFGTVALTDPDALARAVELADRERVSLEQRFMARISGFLAENRTRVTGGLRNKAQVQDVARELHGQSTGNANAAEYARAIEAAQEESRRLFNALGGDIGKLENRGLAHSHNARAIDEAGFDDWFRFLWDKNLIEWSRITDFSTGRPFAADPGARPPRELAERFLRGRFDTIVTGGAIDRTPSMGGGGRALWRRGSEHRVLHFRDGDAWLAYNDRFGSANPFDAIIGELRGRARDIALMRAFGPNPQAGVDFAAQLMQQQVLTEGRQRRAWNILGSRPLPEVVDRKNRKARVMLRLLNGSANVPADRAMAIFFAGVRNVLTAAQLGTAIVLSVTDMVTVRLAAKSMGMNAAGPFQQAMRSVTDRIGRQEAADLGYVLDTWFHAGAAQARFIGDVWSPEWTNRLTNFTLRSTGLSAWTDHMRSGVRMSFSVELGEMATRSWDDLDPLMQKFFAEYQITAADWDALRAPGALYRLPSGGHAISPAWFAEHSGLPLVEREAIAGRLARAVEDFTETAVPSASLRGRASIVGEAPPGSIGGELLRSTAQYKSFSLSLMFNQSRRAMLLGGWSGGLYAAALIAQLTLMGALAVQLKEIVKGRDPRDMTSLQFWGAATLQGGGIGIFGDFLTATASRSGGGLAETIGGPVVGLGADIGRAVVSNTARMAEGRRPLFGRDAVNLARRYNPLASHVAVRTALDRMVWDQLQLLVDPEAREAFGMARRNAVASGTDFFWRRGDMLPARAPNPANIGGPN